MEPAEEDLREAYSDEQSRLRREQTNEKVAPQCDSDEDFARPNNARRIDGGFMADLMGNIPSGDWTCLECWHVNPAHQSTCDGRHRCGALKPVHSGLRIQTSSAHAALSNHVGISGELPSSPVVYRSPVNGGTSTTPFPGELLFLGVHDDSQHVNATRQYVVPTEAHVGHPKYDLPGSHLLVSEGITPVVSAPSTRPVTFPTISYLTEVLNDYSQKVRVRALAQHIGTSLQLGRPEAVTAVDGTPPVEGTSPMTQSPSPSMISDGTDNFSGPVSAGIQCNPAPREARPGLPEAASAVYVTEPVRTFPITRILFPCAVTEVTYEVGQRVSAGNQLNESPIEAWLVSPVHDTAAVQRAFPTTPIPYAEFTNDMAYDDCHSDSVIAGNQCNQASVEGWSEPPDHEGVSPVHVTESEQGTVPTTPVPFPGDTYDHSRPGGSGDQCNQASVEGWSEPPDHEGVSPVHVTESEQGTVPTTPVPFPGVTYDHSRPGGSRDQCNEAPVDATPGPPAAEGPVHDIAPGLHRSGLSTDHGRAAAGKERGAAALDETGLLPPERD